ncbi:MAG: hypothetical protein K2J54_03710, partial [Clostridia bacterium]|nr:hypothetical protein [Clostridia bacterium]
MKNIVQNEQYGEIVYEESFWTGSKNITVNGEALEKVSRKEFRTASGEQVLVKGNFLTGVKLAVGSDLITITPNVTWYEILFAVLPFVLIMVWGNTVALCRIVPVVGGAIGGAISAALGAVSLFLMRSVKPLWLKLIIGVAMLGATFGICCGIGYAIVGILT